jgi:hypothetical protein
LETAREAAKKSGIPNNRIYVLEVPEKFAGKSSSHGLKTVDDFIREGAKLDRLEPLNWDAGDGALRSAFLCYSSGTSGLPVRCDTFMDLLGRLLTPHTERCNDLSQKCHREYK